MFDWLGDILSGLGDALSVVFEGIGADIAVDIWNALVEWIYNTVFDAVADLFTSMNNMGAEIFSLSWVNAVVRLFTLFGWALFTVGVVGAVFEVAIESQSGRVSIKGAALNVLKGCFACALDGCFGSADAALNEPYAGTGDDCGVLYYSDEQVAGFCKAANRAGLQIEMHAIGDRAFDQATRALKAALDDFPRKDHRHGIIHDCLPTKAGLEICAEYGIQFPMQTSFIDWPQEPDSYLQQLLGDERAGHLNPLRSIADADIVMSAGSDAPCTDPDPILWMERACNHSNPAQALSVQEALRMCTYNGYWTTFDEGERGSLEAGKIADMVVLSESPYDVPKEELGRIKVEQLLLGGKPYEKQRQGFVAALIKGMLAKKRCAGDPWHEGPWGYRFMLTRRDSPHPPAHASSQMESKMDSIAAFPSD